MKNNNDNEMTMNWLESIQSNNQSKCHNIDWLQNESNRKNHAFLRGTLVKLYDILRKRRKSNRFVCSITQPSLVQFIITIFIVSKSGRISHY